MRILFSTLSVFTALTLSSFANAADQAPTKEVTLSVSEVYVPGGFSENTDAFVIVSGMFPNSCYAWARADVKNTSQKLHEVKFFANVSQAMCLMVMVPYQKEVNLGRLVAGEHTLRFLNGDGTFFEKTLTVE